MGIRDLFSKKATERGCELASRQTTEHQPPESSRPGQGEFDGVAPHYDHLMRNVPYRDWVDYVEALIKRSPVDPKLTLDLCCGTGRVGSEMIRRGYEVLGVDLSEPMVKCCPDQSPPMAAAVSDAAHLSIKPGAVELVVSLYDSLNYILEPEMLARCFIDVHQALAPGGLFIFDLNTPRALSSGLFSQNNLRAADSLLYSWEANWDAKSRICRVEMWFRWREGDEDKVFEETHLQYAYRHSEVLEMLAAAGFDGIDAYNAYSFRPVTRWSDRAFYVAYKEH